MLKRLYILIMAVAAIAILATGLVAIQVISSYNEQNNRDYLLSAARLIQIEMKDGRTAEQASALTLQASSASENKMRITIVSRQGDVLYDNEATGPLENHLFRPEISYALQNKTIGSAVRRSSTLNEDMRYLALYDANQDLVIRTAMPLKVYRTGLNSILLAIVIVMGVALLLLVLIGSAMVRRITRPLVKLKQAALAMSAGELHTRVHYLQDNGGEISALANAFNTMAQRLETVVHDLEDKNARLDVIFNSMTDPLLVMSSAASVTYMNRTARETFGRSLDPEKSVYPLLLITHSEDTEKLVGKALAAAKPVSAELSLRTVRGEVTYQIMASPILTPGSSGVIMTFHDISESKKLQKMRSDFVANVTHELRTPLTSIRGFIETLRGGAIRNPEHAERFLEIIDIEAERLHMLISDILILSEIENLREEKDRETFDLNALIDDVAVLLDDAAAAGKVNIVVEAGETPLPVSANRYRIKQILINLADNAIKYNQPGGKVYLSAERQPDGKVRLTVRDTGLGIPPEHQDRIFERFYRVDASRSKELGGTGLGLSIVKHIAQLYDGAASVASQPGEGSTFTVTLAI